MHEALLLHKIFCESSAIGHRKRQDALITCVDGILKGARLTVTDIGRHAPGSALIKHKIKQSDRLISNIHLNEEKKAIYQSTLKYLVRPVMYVLVDWSQIELHCYHTLRASVHSKKRSFTLYEELHEEKSLGNSIVQEQFLKTLKAMLPADTEVIIIADAGFKTDFFQTVLSLGWDFIVRIRSNMLFQDNQSLHWRPCPDFYKEATNKPKYIGTGKLSKSTKTPANLYSYQGYKAGKKVKRKIKNTTQDKAYSKRHKQPWLIASSLKKPANWIIDQYKKRMKIEHEFRDMKDRNWGLGLNDSKSKGAVRLSNLLLISHLVCFLLWIIGLWAEQNNWHYQFQSNSCSHRRVLSLIFLGRLVLKSQNMINEFKLSIKNMNEIIKISIEKDYNVL